jgi:putative ABC transport system substrate-binding protein
MCLGAVALAAQAAGPDPPMPPGGRPWRIGWLGSGSAEDAASRRIVAIVVDALRAKGWRFGEHYVIDLRYVGGDAARYPPLADELLANEPDVLYGLETAARVLVGKTRRIPIVMATSIDPVGAGLVRSLAAPGTNVTGMTGQTDEVVAKQVELISELLPAARRIGLLFDPGWAGAEGVQRHAERAGRAKGLVVLALPFTDAVTAREAVQRLVAARADAVIVYETPGTWRLAGDFGPLLRQARLPVSTLGAGEHPALRPLLRFGQDLLAQIRESADFIDAIFRGAKASDLPVRQATRFLLKVDLGVARELGIVVPQAILLRADEVVE